MAEREIMIGGRRLSQLKVDELKVELERRGLRKSGNKGVLIERLQEAIDKEMEQKEGYESFSTSQQMQPQPVANAWPHAMMQQQQQQQKHPGGFNVQPMRIQQQGLLNQQQGILNVNQQQMMLNQQQQITSPVHVNEFREQWPQAQMSQAQILQSQVPQSQVPQSQVSQAQVPQAQVPQAQVPQAQVPQAQVLQAQLPKPTVPYHEPQENQTPLNQMPPEPVPLTHPPSQQVVQPSIEPELESSSSSDNEQDSVQQSSSSSSPDTDDQEREKPMSLLNYTCNYPVEHKPKTAVSVEAVKDNESGTIKEEGQGEDDKAMPLNNAPEENLTVDSAPADEEMKPQVEEKEEEGEIKEEEEEQKTCQEEKEKEIENEKENEPPQETANTAESQQQPSPAEENTFEVEPSEEDKAVVEEPKVPSPPKSTSPFVTKKRKISIPRTSLPSTPTSEGQPASRKRRWGSSSSSKKKTSLSISTDSLKDLIPGVQVHSTPALEAVMDLGDDDEDEKEAEEEEKKMEQKVEEEKEPAPVQTPEAIEPEGKRRKDRIVKVEEKKTVKLQRKPVVFEKEQEPEPVKMEVEEDPITPKTDNPHTRRTSLPAQEASSPTPAERSPSPARYPESDVLHVKNLVRPFTLNQLKDLLGKHGTLAEGGFWIDKIKSHCYVMYASVEEAAASRQALHGVKWPLTSPKILAVDFANEEEMARDTEGVLGKKKEKDRDVKAEKVVKKKPPVAEEKPAAEEAMEVEEEEQKNPGNLLDNLFKKTKTTPCLYWLPLSDDQIATRDREREERRKARQEERDKENEERKEKQQQREKEREKEKRERESEKQRSRSPRNRRRERSKSRSKSPRGPRRR